MQIARKPLYIGFIRISMKNYTFQQDPHGHSLKLLRFGKSPRIHLLRPVEKPVIKESPQPIQETNGIPAAFRKYPYSDDALGLLVKFKKYIIRCAARLTRGYPWIDIRDVIQYGTISMIETLNSTDFLETQDEKLFTRRVKYAFIDSMAVLRGFKASSRDRYTYCETPVSPFDIEVSNDEVNLLGVCYHQTGITENEITEALDKAVFANQLNGLDKLCWQCFIRHESYEKLAEVTGLTPNQLYGRMRRLTKKFAAWTKQDDI